MAFESVDRPGGGAQRANSRLGRGARWPRHSISSARRRPASRCRRDGNGCSSIRCSVAARSAPTVIRDSAGFCRRSNRPAACGRAVALRYLADVPIEAQATRRSRILKIENKAGQTRLTVVRDGSAHHQLRWDGVHLRGAGYRLSRDHRRPGGVCTRGAASRRRAAMERERRAGHDAAVSLFGADLQRASHPLRPAYAREQEGYPDLVVHGPLTATLLQQFALDHGAGRALARFDFRGVTPLFVGRTFLLEGRQAEDGALALWARGPEGELAMSATAAFR